MSKTRYIVLILVAVVAALAIEVLFGGWMSARLSTWPPLRKFNLFNPQAPIVINNREIIRQSDTQDAIDAANRAKSRLSAVAMLQGNRLVVTGTAVNLTADGYFVTAASSFALRGGTYYVVLNNGEPLPISGLFADPGTNLMFFNVTAASVPVTDFADSEGLLLGQKLVFLSSSLNAFTTSFKQSWVSTIQNNTGGRIFSSDRPGRSFGAQGAGSLMPGEAAVTLDGEVAGLWDGSTFVSSNVIRRTMDLLFANNKQVIRPTFGFYYRSITRAESSALSVPQGALVTKPDTTVPAVVANGPAATAGLREGDYIIQIGNTKIEENTLVEEVLERIRVGDTVPLTIVRDRQTMIINVKVGEQR